MLTEVDWSILKESAIIEASIPPSTLKTDISYHTSFVRV